MQFSFTIQVFVSLYIQDTGGVNVIKHYYTPLYFKSFVSFCKQPESFCKHNNLKVKYSNCNISTW